MAIALLALGAAGLLLAWLAAPPSDQRGEPLHLAVGEVVIIHPCPERGGVVERPAAADRVILDDTEP